MFYKLIIVAKSSCDEHETLWLLTFQGQSQSVPIYYAPPQPAGHNATRPSYQPAACSSYSALPSVDRSGIVKNIFFPLSR